jgi:tripartite-type tricarboxylate transporter receptor subunit TctC
MARHAICRTAGLVLAAIVAGSAAQAQPVADFYRGKTLNMLVGVGAGGEYDLLARLVSKYLPRYIPGHPVVVAQNMTGASGLKMANYIYAQAPRDGTYIGIVQNTLIAAQAVGLPGVQFDAAKLDWLGSIAPVVETMAVWHTTAASPTSRAPAGARSSPARPRAAPSPMDSRR